MTDEKLQNFKNSNKMNKDLATSKTQKITKEFFYSPFQRQSKKILYLK